MAKILPHKHIIAAYGAAIAGLPSQIAYGNLPKNPLSFNYDRDI